MPVFPSLLAASSDSDLLRQTGIYVVCLVLSVAVHEFCHAFAAHKLGDPTPESQDRLTLNPLAHIDVVGTLGMPVMAGLFGFPVFGWGKPVQTQPRYYTRKVSMRLGMAIVALAGPLGNLALLFVVTGIGSVLALTGLLNPQVNELLLVLASLNLLLMVFNLLPLHPLDGGKILAFFLPAKFQYIDEFSQRYGGYLLILMVVVGSRLLYFVFSPFMEAMSWVWTHAVTGLL